MMTKTLVITAVIIEILLCIGGFIYLQAKTNEISNLSSVYNARKDELLAQQHQLEGIISQLNQSVQTAIVREKDLNNQLASLNPGSGAVSGSNSGSSSSGQVATPPLPGAPSSPVSLPVTRAS